MAINEKGRSLLREAVVGIGLPSDTGNRLADWFDAHEAMKVSITGELTPFVFVVHEQAPEPEPPIDTAAAKLRSTTGPEPAAEPAAEEDPAPKITTKRARARA